MSVKMEMNHSIDSDQAQHEENIGLDQLEVSGDAIGDMAAVLGNVGRSASNNSSGDNIDMGNDAANKSWNLTDVKCDDCSRTEPIRQWRWCNACERVLCETCGVEGHNTHIIESYATGVRRSDNEHREVMEEVRLMVDLLTEGAKKADELKADILNKLSSIKRDMIGKVNECKDVEDTVNGHLTAMNKLERKPLNAKTWIERNQSVVGAEELMKVAFEKQKKLDEYSKALDTLVDETGRKLGEIFREEK